MSRRALPPAPVLGLVGLALVALLVVVALAWAASSSGGGRSEGPGWSAGSAVSMTEPLARFMDDLADGLGFQVFVTSAARSAQDQARAMLKKVELGGEDELAIYGRRDLVAELLAASRELSAWTAVIDEQVSRGDYLSRHLSGRALDLRTTGSGEGQLTEDQIAKVTRAAQDLGAKVLREDTPPHLHLEIPSEYLS